MAPAKSNPNMNVHDSDSHTRFEEAHKEAEARIVSLETDFASIRASLTVIKWLFGIGVGLLATMLFGGLGWAWSMQASVASIQKDVAVQAANSQNQDEGRRQLGEAIKELNAAVQELRLKVERQ